MYFDDLHEGYRFETGTRTLTEADIVRFAREWDPQDFHLDADAARQSPYGGLIASGFHTMLTAFVLSLEADVWKQASMGSPGMDDIRWLRPVRPGDTLKAEATVLKSVPSASRSDRGRTTIRYDVRNQSDEVVMTYTAIHILRRRPV
ncbi:MaoC/PaaZ C-terminal domain-containing protein [Roseovarius salis]|uniref:MaoC family dehydratase n=1 Tax=Roseovarius salis TaxID=3376063 RepID=UPI0037C83234